MDEVYWWFGTGLLLPGGVNGNTEGFGPSIPGSSPGRVGPQIDELPSNNSWQLKADKVMDNPDIPHGKNRQGENE